MSSTQKHILLILGLGIIFFFPFLGGIHLFDWDEINFAESAREMIVTQDYWRVRINYEPFWEKPPFFFWLQVISMKIFGVNEFAARFPNALVGLITLLVLYQLGKKLYNEKFGLIWSLLYLASFLPHLYFKSGIIDPVFNLFIFLSVYFLAQNINNANAKGKWAFLSGFFIGLAIITKGPVGLLLVILTFFTYLIFKKFRKKIRVLDLLIFIATSATVTFLWFGYEVMNHGPWFVIEFIEYQIELFSQPVAGHEQPFYYHFIVVLVGCFPMSIIALKGFSKKVSLEKDAIDFGLWMKILFWVVIILFSIAKTKIVHYSSMAYLPLSFIAANYLYYLIKNKESIGKIITGLLILIGFIFSVLLIICPILFKEKNILISFMKDDFAVASFNYDMGWSGYEFLIGLIYLLGLIVGIRFLILKKHLHFLFILSISAGLTLLLYSKFVVPKIERFSQGPVIDFCKEVADEDAYIFTIGYKSYAPYFYGKIKPPKATDQISQIREKYIQTLEKSEDFDANALNQLVKQWLLNEEIDKRAYFITKIHEKEEMKKYPHIHFIKNAGGFDFYYRGTSTLVLSNE